MCLLFRECPSVNGICERPAIHFISNNVWLIHERPEIHFRSKSVWLIRERPKIHFTSKSVRLIRDLLVLCLLFP